MYIGTRDLAVHNTAQYCLTIPHGIAWYMVEYVNQI